MTRLRTRLESGADDGVSLVELLVVMGLIGILGAVTAATTIGSMRTSQMATERGEDTARARVVLDQLTKVLRTATDPDGDGGQVAVDTASPSSVTVYAALDTLDGVAATAPKPPKRVTFTVTAAGDLVETSTPGVRDTAGVATWPGPSTIRTLARGLRPAVGGSGGPAGCSAAPASRPYFTYLADSDSLTPAGLDCGGGSRSSLATGGSVVGATRSSIDGIELWISLRGDDSYDGPAVALTNRVTLINE